MKRKRILVDVDGVLADFVGAYLNIIKQVTGRVYAREDATDFDIGASLGLTKQESSACKRALGAAGPIARMLEPYEGAQAGIALLQQHGAVYIVTSPWNSNPTWTHDREHWLEKHFGIPHSMVIHTSAKFLVRGDVFIDDKVIAVDTWRSEHPNGLPIVWSTPHNRRDLWDGPCTNDWKHVIELMESM